MLRRVSLDSDPLAEDDDAFKRIDRLMRDKPTPRDVMRGIVTTRNGNVVQAVTR